ncbi:MAG: CDP-alcohol phosphatidyltransferase family protein [Flavobacteriaceae bacterium]|nr:CDP-alcohol phosphatidyltransferase family protein [Flavobacteriaceae bacterium]
MRFEKHLPNILTLLNLFCGILAIFYNILGEMSFVFMFVVFGLVFDFLDGFLARLLKVHSQIGKHLDSLADVVTFGIVPGLVMFNMLYWSQMPNNFGHGFFHYYLDMATLENGFDIIPTLPMFGLLITLASAYRLAKFNADAKQTNYFIGLATPANAIFILSFAMMLHENGPEFLGGLLLNSYFLIGITLFSSIMLNAPMRLFSLKTTSYGFRDNLFRYIFVVFALGAFFTLGYVSIPISIVIYMLFSQVFSYRLGLKDLEDIVHDR